MERIEKYEAKYDGEVFLNRLKKRKERIIELFDAFAELQADQDLEVDDFLQQFARTGQPTPSSPEITYIPNYGQYRDWFLNFFRRLKTATAQDIETLHQEWLQRGFTEDFWQLLKMKWELQHQTLTRLSHGKLICEWLITPFESFIISRTVQSEFTITPKEGDEG
jgi:hypothetical protein